MSDETVNLLCKGCGQVFSAFLKEMADKNARVVCPKCGGCHEYTRADIVSSASKRTGAGKR
jgi:hypothetical protein